MHSKKHYCKWNLGSDSILAKDGGVANRLWRSIRNMCQISRHHPETYDRFYSHPAVIAERQRHMYEGGCFLIHPFSLCSLFWITIMACINLAHMCCSTFRLCYIIMPVKDMKPHYVDSVLLALNSFCWIDVILKFHTGYVVGEMTNIVIDKPRITWRYLRRWFLIDVLSCIPVALIFLHWYPHKPRHLLVTHMFPLLRCARLYTVVVDLKVILKIFTKSFIVLGCVRNATVFLVTCHWCGCIVYLPPVLSLYWYGEISTEYASFLNMADSTRSILNYSTTDRYIRSIFISLTAFFGTGFSLLKSSKADEILLFSLVVIYGSLFMVYNFAFLLKIYMIIYGSTIRYQELMNQVEEYMRHQQFPLPLKRRVRAFYYYRYQGRYFDENKVLHSLSEGLRNEITLHTCSRLVEKVELFQGVEPSVIGYILGCLQPEVYMPNESVVRAGELGQCMYFVANGTVAVYSLKGVELCHLEDGAHFGEVALLMKDNKHVATVVAVEITLLYRLDREDFQQYIMKDDTLFERIEVLASQRMHDAVIMDDNREQGIDPQRNSATSFIAAPQATAPQ